MSDVFQERSNEELRNSTVWSYNVMSLVRYHLHCQKTAEVNVLRYWNLTVSYSDFSRGSYEHC